MKCCDDFICGYNGSGVVWDIEFESGVHLFFRVIRGRVLHHRDVVPEFSGKPNGGLHAGVGDEPRNDQLVNAMFFELQIQICVGETTGTPVFRGHDVAGTGFEFGPDLTAPSAVFESLSPPRRSLDWRNVLPRLVVARAILPVQRIEHADFRPSSAERDANKFLEAEYWPEWNERFARPLQGVTDMHRALTPQTDLASALSHVEQRVISNDYTFSFAGRRYQLARQQVKTGMRGKSLRIELHLNGTLRARFEGQYVEVNECGAKAPETAKAVGKPSRKDHNRGGKSDWMEGFFERPGPELWQAVRTANDRS